MLLCKIAPQIRSSARLMGLTTLSSARVALRHHTVKARPRSAVGGALTLATRTASGGLSQNSKPKCKVATIYRPA